MVFVLTTVQILVSQVTRERPRRNTQLRVTLLTLNNRALAPHHPKANMPHQDIRHSKVLMVKHRHTVMLRKDIHHRLHISNNMASLPLANTLLSKPMINMEHRLPVLRLLPLTALCSSHTERLQRCRLHHPLVTFPVKWRKWRKATSLQTPTPCVTQ